MGFASKTSSIPWVLRSSICEVAAASAGGTASFEELRGAIRKIHKAPLMGEAGLGRVSQRRGVRTTRVEPSHGAAPGPRGAPTVSGRWPPDRLWSSGYNVRADLDGVRLLGYGARRVSRKVVG